MPKDTKREAELRDAIAHLEDVLNAGADSQTEDGQSVAFNLEHSEKRLQNLRRELARVTGSTMRRPFSGNFNLNGGR